MKVETKDTAVIDALSSRIKDKSRDEMKKIDDFYNRFVEFYKIMREVVHTGKMEVPELFHYYKGIEDNVFGASDILQECLSKKDTKDMDEIASQIRKSKREKQQTDLGRLLPDDWWNPK